MLYRGFTQAELDQEYSPRSMIGGDLTPYLNSYAALSAQYRAQMDVIGNVSYGDGTAQVLDFFPAKGAGAPLHVFIHGGYWQALSQRESAMMAPALVEAEYSFASLNYTLAPDARIGDMIEECRNALLWLAANAHDLGFDPSRVTLSGHSAGAQLASMVMATSADALARAGLRVRDVILISGVYDLEPISLTPVNEPLQLTPVEVHDLSPIRHLPAPGPRYRVTVGERDTPEFIRQSRDYAELLRKAGHSVSFDLQNGVQHFDIIMHPATFLAAPR
ncbi:MULTISPECIES: alpha/beta hydrolase [unclassified Ruegeria]|uniref:alpha/beta hydrolase n=1 Tax=unclassified Ruegeria TaxID=2625375 RepID=UPI001ADCEA49|nr:MULTISPECIES: alpha/beta hydrolase [unclassified Ruegeria]MBO9411786.1 alpha/beta hydrolase [Ruegeria sp. R8_1]MBO9415653.1 alpha/beta hydrolase [Ruegeria sp. R8_2]